MNFSRSTLLGLLLSLLSIVIIGFVRVLAEQPSPAQKTIIIGETTMYFETDRKLVWREGDCVNLYWNVEHIQAIYLNRMPTVGNRTMIWCADQQEAIPFFTIELPDGRTEYLAPFEIATVRDHLILLLIPLWVLAGWCFKLHLKLARGFKYLPKWVQYPFSVSGKIQPILVVLFLGTNAIVVWNTVTIRAAMGYDVEGHLANVMALSAGHLSTSQESAEFFSPPMPYIVPAIVSRVAGSDATVIQKLGQLQNILVSLISTFVLLRIGARLYPTNATARALLLFLFGTLTVYYKSLAFMRGEPFVMMFTLLLCDHILALMSRKPMMRDGLLIGVYGGLMLLSRQWGALVLAGAAVWYVLLILRQKSLAKQLLLPGLVAGLITIVLGGWFYLALATQSGSVLAFNRQADTAEKPISFFTGLGGANLITYPYSPGFDGQAIPIFYTEMWGDYFGYFYLERPPIPSRFPPSAVTYLGLVNAVSIIPTLVLVAGFIYGIIQIIRFLFSTPVENTTIHSLFFLCIAASLAGFIWFLIRYPSRDADTAKATYLLHVFPLLCLLAVALMQHVEQRWPKLFRGICISLVIVAIINFPVFFPRIS
jgi:hypothetical protein